MALPPAEIQDRITRFKLATRRAGVKLTHQRLEIFAQVAQSVEHPDAETVYRGVRKRLPTVSLDTVYRTLWLLIDLGVLATLGPPRGRARFDANTRAHHHFVCLHCGLARDFTNPAFNALRVPVEVKAWGHVERTLVEVRGCCTRCAKKQKKNIISPRPGAHLKGPEPTLTGRRVDHDEQHTISSHHHDPGKAENHSGVRRDAGGNLRGSRACSALRRLVRGSGSCGPERRHG